MADIEVGRDHEHSRYVARVGGESAGFAAYELAGGRIVFTHTEIDPRFEGQGVGSTLVRAALDDVRAAGHGVVARCPFVAGWIDRHPDYAGLCAR